MNDELIYDEQTGLVYVMKRRRELRISNLFVAFNFVFVTELPSSNRRISCKSLENQEFLSDERLARKVKNELKMSNAMVDLSLQLKKHRSLLFLNNYEHY